MDPHVLRFANVTLRKPCSAFGLPPLGMGETDRLAARGAETPPPPLLRVRVDLVRLRENLSTAWRRRLSSREVVEFLTRAGFSGSDDGAVWLAPEPVLMRLDPSEVVWAEAVRGHGSGGELNCN